MDLTDHDTVSLTNLNRQIIATRDVIGAYKTKVMAARIAQINPEAKVRTQERFFLPECACEFPFASYDYVVDAVDTVTAKIALILQAREANVPIISSMGAGNKLDGSAFMVSDVYETSVCPLARVMRRELKKRGVERLKVVWSKEAPLHAQAAEQTGENSRNAPGSIAFVPAVAGLLLAGEVVKDLTNFKEI